MSNNLERRRRLWYAVLDVPADVRDVIGRRRYVQSLKTENLSEARRLVGSVVAHWKHLIHLARGEDRIAVQALVWRDILSKTESKEEKEHIRDLIGDEADRLLQKGVPSGVLNADEAFEVSSSTDEATRFYQIASGKRTPLLDYEEPWLADARGSQKTKDMHKSNLRLLKKRHAVIEDVDRRAASEFVRKVLKPKRSIGTVNRMISTYSGYWRWLIDRGYLPETYRNPWERQRPLAQRAHEPERRTFTEDEAEQLLAALKRTENKYPDDFTVMAVLACTGMRIDEAASLEVGDVRMDQNIAWLHVRHAKTKAGIRTVPLLETSVLQNIESRLGHERWLFDALSDDRYGNRAQALSKRANRMLDKIIDDPALVAGHSWRHRARTLMEHGGIDPWTCDWFIGHERPGEGFNRYSTGPSEEQLIAAARAIPFPRT